MRVFALLSILLALMPCAPEESKGGGSSGTSSDVAPSIVSVPTTSATEGIAYRYTPTATGTPTPSVDVMGFPAWLSWDGTHLSGTPGMADVGTTPQISVTATNGVDPDALQTFSIGVAPDQSGGGGGSNDVPPQILSTPITTATEGFQYTYALAANGTPAPMFSAMNLPSWLSLSGGALSGTPGSGDVGATGQITITATNGVAPDAQQTFSIIVSPAPTGPVLTVSGAASVAEGTGGTMQATFDVDLAPGSPPILTVSVDYGTFDGTAKAGEDFTGVSDTLIFNPGETTKQITVEINPGALARSPFRFA